MLAPRPAPVAQEPTVPTARGPAFDRPNRPRHSAGPARRSPRVRVPRFAPIHTLLLVVAAPHVTEAGEVAAVAPPDIHRQAKGRGRFPGRPRWPPRLQPETGWAEGLQGWCWGGESACPAAVGRRVKEAIACGRGPPANVGWSVVRDGRADSAGHSGTDFRANRCQNYVQGTAVLSTKCWQRFAAKSVPEFGSFRTSDHPLRRRAARPVRPTLGAHPPPRASGPPEPGRRLSPAPPTAPNRRRGAPAPSHLPGPSAACARPISQRRL
jgi:hypothetical protein